MSANNQRIQECNDGSFCTGFASDNCCATPGGFRLLDNHNCRARECQYNYNFDSFHHIKRSELNFSIQRRTLANIRFIASKHVSLTTKHEHQAGFLAGAVVGGVVLTALLITTGAVLIRRNKRKAYMQKPTASQNRDESQTHPRAFWGGELDGLEKLGQLDGRERLELEASCAP